mgnify:FL=1
MANIALCSQCGRKNRYAYDSEDTLCAKCMSETGMRQTVKVKVKRKQEADEE